MPRSVLVAVRASRTCAFASIVDGLVERCGAAGARHVIPESPASSRVLCAPHAVEMRARDARWTVGGTVR